MTGILAGLLVTALGGVPAAAWLMDDRHLLTGGSAWSSSQIHGAHVATAPSVKISGTTHRLLRPGVSARVEGRGGRRSARVDRPDVGQPLGCREAVARAPQRGVDVALVVEDDQCAAVGADRDVAGPAVASEPVTEHPNCAIPRVSAPGCRRNDRSTVTAVTSLACPGH